METTPRLRLGDANYHCTSCGDCCRGWHVTLIGDEATRVRAHLAPLVPAKRLSAALDRHSLRQGAQGCVALTDEQQCRIHAAHGAAAKPTTCRIFPLSFTNTPSGVRVGISYACPGVLDEAGPTLEQQREEITTLYSSAVRGTTFVHTVPEQIVLDKSSALDWEATEALLDSLTATLSADGALVERMARARALLDRLGQGLQDGEAFPVALAAATASAAATAAARLKGRRPPDFFSQTLLRAIIVTGTLKEAGSFARLASMAATLLGGKGVTLRDGRTIPQAAIDGVPAGLGPDGERLVLRWLLATVEGLGFFGTRAFDLTVSAGFELLTVATAAVGLVARAHAAASGRTAPALADARQAVHQIESSLYHRAQVPDRLYRLLDDINGVDLLAENV